MLGLFLVLSTFKDWSLWCCRLGRYATGSPYGTQGGFDKRWPSGQAPRVDAEVEMVAVNIYIYIHHIYVYGHIYIYGEMQMDGWDGR